MAEELWRAHSLEKSKDTDGGETTSGSFSYWADDPKIEFSKHTIGTYFDPITGKSLAGPASNSIKITKVSVTDSVIGMKQGRPFRQWQITIEGDTTSSGDNSAKTTYDIEEYKDDNGLVYRKATVTVINDGDAPTFKIVDGPGAPTIKLGDAFSVLDLAGWQGLTCTRISGGDEWTDKDVHRWTMTYEGSKIAIEEGEDLKPEDSGDGDNVSYELNGMTARAVDGEFIILRRSTSPITKRSITKYADDDPSDPNAGVPPYKPGDSYGGLGQVTSVRTTKETIKENGVEIGSYYRHDIEVER